MSLATATPHGTGARIPFLPLSRDRDTSPSRNPLGRDPVSARAARCVALHRADAVTVAETILVFAGIPLLIVAVMAALIFLPGGRNRPRWKSGRSWEHAPVWYEPHPEGVGAGHGEHAALPAGTSAAGSGGPLGGARGTW